MGSGMAFASHWALRTCMEFYDGILIQRQNGIGGGKQALDAPDAKMVLIEELRQIGKTVIAASGLAGDLVSGYPPPCRPRRPGSESLPQFRPTRSLHYCLGWKSENHENGGLSDE